VGQTVTGSVTRNFNFSEFIAAGVAGFINAQTLALSINGTGSTLGTVTYTTGTGSLQVDTIYCKPLTLSGATTTLNLNSGLTDPDGNSISFARVREAIAFNPDTVSTHDVKVYAGASNGWAVLGPLATPSWVRNNNGLWNLSDPTSTGAGNGNVVTTSSCNIVFDPGANTVTIWVLFAGGSVA
jgi:hypothetical protein